VVVGITPNRRQRIGRKRDEVLQCEPPCDVFSMGIQPAILVYHENGRQLGRCFGTGVLAEWPDEVAADVAISIGRGYGLVARLDSLVVFANLLPECVVRHQRLDNCLRTKASNCETLHSTKEVTTADLAVNVTCVQFHRSTASAGIFI